MIGRTCDCASAAVAKRSTPEPTRFLSTCGISFTTLALRTPRRRLSSARPREPRAVVDLRSDLLPVSWSLRPARYVRVAWALSGSGCLRGPPLPGSDYRDPALRPAGFLHEVLARSP